jgi:very-short-patch-repair endonuclease
MSDECDGRLGVVFHHVAGIYNASRNEAEARAVADAVLRHMVGSSESLGVAAMNIQQRELIEDEIDRRLKHSAMAQAWVERHKDSAEPFFVKNLENVQGDERDVIFVSVTYGPDQTGRVRKNFGPINKEGGHRRLNVLFTRAKRRLEVFSTMRGGDIAIDTGESEGTRTLREYLHFAEKGRAALEGTIADRPADSDFEVAVMDTLSDRGYRCVPQVGAAGYRIDIGVVDPDEPGRFLLGVECDGATYHSSRCARDRDRLREKVLCDMGWVLFRIWSADWFKNRPRVVERLLTAIETARADAQREREQRPARKSVQVATVAANEAVGEEPVRAVSLANEESDESSGLSNMELHDGLVQLRENELLIQFPDADSATCFLRNEMIDDLVAKQPADEEEFKQLVRPELRDRTDLEQFRAFKARAFSLLKGREMPSKGTHEMATANRASVGVSGAMPTPKESPPTGTTAPMGRREYRTIEDVVAAVDETLRYPVCPKCKGVARIVVSGEGVVLSCGGQCRSNVRLAAELLQRVAGELGASCFSCEATDLRSVEKPFGVLLKCAKCGSNNTWQGVVGRYFQSK